MSLADRWKLPANNSLGLLDPVLCRIGRVLLPVTHTTSATYAKNDSRSNDTMSTVAQRAGRRYDPGPLSAVTQRASALPGSAICSTELYQ